MLAGKKPMRVFYRVVGETFDETNGQPFFTYVKHGKIHATHFFVRNGGEHFRPRYTVYTLRGHEWRAAVYRALKLAGQRTWCEAMESVERKLYEF